MIRLVASASLMAVLALAGGGCGSSGEAPADSGAVFKTCATDDRAMPYRAGMSVSSDGGTFTVKLVGSDPGPPVKGRNIWTVEIDASATGLPLDGLDLSVTPWMPDHMHGSTPVVVTPTAAGNYDLEPVYLYMSGLWEVRMTIVGTMVGAGTTDTATLPICIK